MPFRLPILQSAVPVAIEAFAVALIGIYSGARYVANIIDDSTWDKVKGAEGALFGAVVIVITLWLSKISDGKRLDKRHSETLALQKENADKLMALTAESIKAHGLTCQTISSVDRTLQSFQQSNEENAEKIVSAMNSKTCHAKTMKELFPNFPQV